MALQFHRHQACRRLLLLLTLLAAVMLSACGFHLRGPLDLPFKSIYLGVPRNTPLDIELSRQIRLSGVEVVRNQADAEVSLVMLSEKRDKKIEALDTSGNVREYSLYERFRFKVVKKDGTVLIAPTVITIKNSITYDPNQELAKQVEEGSLYNAMQHDVVEQILRRLGAAVRPKPDATDDDDSTP